MSKYNKTSLVFLSLVILIFCLPTFTIGRHASPLSLLDLDFDSSSSSSHHHTLRNYRPPPPHRPKTNRAWVGFSSPPDIVKGVVVFWETSKNNTIVAGQFSTGFVEGEEADYTFKLYRGSKEVIDLKPSDDLLDKLFKIRPDGATDFFLFTIEDKLLISGEDSILGTTFVIGRPGVLLGKNEVGPLSCH
ncbi:5442_t:CDS:1 [Acaulospora morrowiae]|uniref:5442_t:CDS:1 n=1 Tax=Acaulospora morrowiae TaxID=94023 RepID=A0A9N9FDU3_9GLOM|nr:5442_t:CDS:1 [Acaulospora morrowiae]